MKYVIIIACAFEFEDDHLRPVFLYFNIVMMMIDDTPLTPFPAGVFSYRPRDVGGGEFWFLI